MGKIGYSAWFGPIPDGAASARVEAVARTLGLEKAGEEPPLLPGMTEVQYASRLVAEPLRMAIGDKAPWGKLSLYPITEEMRRELGDEGVRVFLRDLSDRLNVVLGRTYGESQLGVVNRSELDGLPEWLDWFQYWGAEIVQRWGISHIERGPFRLVEPRPNGACAVTLLSGPDDPQQMVLQAKAVAYLGIRLRPRQGRPL